MKPTPAQRALMISNREILAERCGWPAGILAVCVHLEQRHPGWDVWWLPENTWLGREAGFAATSLGDMTLTDSDDLRPAWPNQTPRVFAADPVELGERIAAMEHRIAEEKAAERRRWDWTRGLR